VLSLNLELVHLEVAVGLLNRVLMSALFELAKGYRLHRTEVLVLSIGIRLKKFNLDLSLNIVFAEVCGAKLNLVPLEKATFRALYLRLVDRSVFSK